MLSIPHNSPFGEIYHRLLYQLLQQRPEKNGRTGHEVRSLPGGFSFKLDLRDRRLPVCGHRRLFPKTAAAEVAWFLSGSQDVTWLQRYCRIWDKFTEADGRTVENAYGYRWRNHFERDQIQGAIEALNSDPSDRQVFISAWDPSSDGLGNRSRTIFPAGEQMAVVPVKNVPCPVGFTFSIVHRELHTTLLIRSSDVFVGLPYDVMGHAILTEIMRTTLDAMSERAVALGTMTVTLAHPHLYDTHWEHAEKAMRDYLGPMNGPALVSMGLGQVTRDPAELVELYEEWSKTVRWPEFNPRPELVL